MVFGVGSHLGIGGHRLRGPTGVGRRPSRPRHPFHLACHFHPKRPHEADVDVRPRADQCAVGGVWGLGWIGGPCHAGGRGHGLGGRIPNAPALSAPSVAHWLCRFRLLGGDVQSAGGGHRVCSGSHHDRPHRFKPRAHPDGVVGLVAHRLCVLRRRGHFDGAHLGSVSGVAASVVHRHGRGDGCGLCGLLEALPGESTCHWTVHQPTNPHDPGRGVDRGGCRDVAPALWGRL